MKVIKEKTNGNSIDIMQEKIKDMAKVAELIIIVGEKNSSQVKEMYEISLKECGNVMLVESIDDLYLNYARRFKTVALIQDDFLSQEKIEEIVDILEHTQVKGYIYGYFK